jgi:hypothetical protein
MADARDAWHPDTMTIASRRLKDIRDAFTALFPLAPFSDAEPIRERAARRDMSQLTAETAVWLAAIAHLRHEHTDYDDLLSEGYDRDAARFFILDEINAILTGWRAARYLQSAEDFDPLEPETADDQEPERNQSAPDGNARIIRRATRPTGSG